MNYLISKPDFSCLVKVESYKVKKTKLRLILFFNLKFLTFNF